MDYNIKFEELIGQTLVAVRGGKVGDESVVFETTDGKSYQLYHIQDCCESVTLNDVCGDLQDLVGSPIVQAEESNSGDTPKDYQCSESCTWTFYRLATAKGQVVLRWLGESNGFYSESVDFVRLS